MVATPASMEAKSRLLLEQDMDAMRPPGPPPGLPPGFPMLQPPPGPPEELSGPLTSMQHVPPGPPPGMPPMDQGLMQPPGPPPGLPPGFASFAELPPRFSQIPDSVPPAGFPPGFTPFGPPGPPPNPQPLPAFDGPQAAAELAALLGSCAPNNVGVISASPSARPPGLQAKAGPPIGPPPPGPPPPECTAVSSLAFTGTGFASSSTASVGEPDLKRRRNAVEGLASNRNIKSGGAVTVYTGYSAVTAAPAPKDDGPVHKESRSVPAPAVHGMEALPRQLPEGWEMKKSRTTGRVYYVNEKLGKSQFDPPAGSTLKATAHKKQRASLRSKETVDAQATDKAGLMGLVRAQDVRANKWQKWQRNSAIINAPDPDEE